MKVAARRLLEEQIAVVVVLERGVKNDAMWHVPQRDIDKIEKIQRRATKMIPEIRKHSYHQRIQNLALISLV